MLSERLVTSGLSCHFRLSKVGSAEAPQWWCLLKASNCFWKETHKIQSTWDAPSNYAMHGLILRKWWVHIELLARWGLFGGESVHLASLWINSWYLSALARGRLQTEAAKVKLPFRLARPSGDGTDTLTKDLLFLPIVFGTNIQDTGDLGIPSSLAGACSTEDDDDDDDDLEIVRTGTSNWKSRLLSESILNYCARSSVVVDAPTKNDNVPFSQVLLLQKWELPQTNYTVCEFFCNAWALYWDVRWWIQCRSVTFCFKALLFLQSCSHHFLVGMCWLAEQNIYATAKRLEAFSPYWDKSIPRFWLNWYQHGREWLWWHLTRRAIVLHGVIWLNQWWARVWYLLIDQQRQQNWNSQRHSHS